MQVTAQEKVDNVLKVVKTASFEERVSVAELEEKEVNEFLDSILQFKSYLSHLSEKLYGFVLKSEEITWLEKSEVTEEILKSVNDLIATISDLYASGLKKWAIYSQSLKDSGIATEEIKDYKKALDELKECYQDLETVFFKNQNTAVDTEINDLLASI